MTDDGQRVITIHVAHPELCSGELTKKNIARRCDIFNSKPTIWNYDLKKENDNQAGID